MSDWFWSNKAGLPTGDKTLVEPKRKFRWVLDINGIPMWTIKKVDKPSYTITTAEHVFINHKFYYPGRVEYNEVSFTIVDAGHPDAAETLRQLIHAGGYRWPEDATVASQSITKHAAVNALGDVVIKQIGGGGMDLTGGASTVDADGKIPQFQDQDNVYELWFLKNAFVTSVEFGDLDYTSDDLSEITIKLRYDYAILNEKSRTPAMSDWVGPHDVAYDVANRGDEPTRMD